MDIIAKQRFCQALGSVVDTMNALNQQIAELSRYCELYCQDAIFIHINKTAGTSINHALGLRRGLFTAREKRAELGEPAWSSKFRFTFVRNPWERIVSQYYWRRSIDHTGLSSQRIDFNTWIVHVLRDHTPEFYDNPKLFMPQLDWISDKDGQLLVNYIGRYERLIDDFRSVCDHLNVKAELPRDKPTCHPPYRDVFNDESIDLVRDWFQKDIDYFGYTY